MTMEIRMILLCQRQRRKRCLQLASMLYDEAATIRRGLLLATRRSYTHLRRPPSSLPLLRQPIAAQSVTKRTVFHACHQSCGCLCLDNSIRNGFSDNTLSLDTNMATVDMRVFLTLPHRFNSYYLNKKSAFEMFKHVSSCYHAAWAPTTMRCHAHGVDLHSNVVEILPNLCTSKLYGKW